MKGIMGSSLALRFFAEFPSVLGYIQAAYLCEAGTRELECVGFCFFLFACGFCRITESSYVSRLQHGGPYPPSGMERFAWESEIYPFLITGTVHYSNILVVVFSLGICVPISSSWIGFICFAGCQFGFFDWPGCEISCTLIVGEAKEVMAAHAQNGNTNMWGFSLTGCMLLRILYGKEQRNISSDKSASSIGMYSKAKARANGTLLASAIGNNFSFWTPSWS